MSYSKALLTALATLALGVQGQQRPHEAITARSLIEQINKNGAKKVVDSTPPKKWDAIMRHIESGSAEWLRVAKELRPGTDAGATDDLLTAVARALTRNPNAVLKMTTGDSMPWPLPSICGEDEIEESDAHVRRRKAAVIRAMHVVTAPQLREQRAACLKTAESYPLAH